MTGCAIHDAGTIELYFYGELDAGARERTEAHLVRCAECAGALGELRLIREALSHRPEVAAPPSGDWTAFMARLDAAVGPEAAAGRVVAFQRPSQPLPRQLAGLLAMAALLMLVTLSVFLASRAGRDAMPQGASRAGDELAAGPGDEDPAMQAALTSVGMHHLERSKLVVLGLAAKEPAQGAANDWAFERELASSLLNDTRLYRQAAEQRGLTTLAGVMRDLELVLLQTSMAEATDTAALPQIQRLIYRRGLVEKMDVVGTTGLLP